MTTPSDQSQTSNSAARHDGVEAMCQDSVESHRRRLLRAAASGMPLMLTVSGASAAAQSGWARHAENLPQLATLPDGVKAVSGSACPSPSVDKFVRQKVETYLVRDNGNGASCPPAESTLHLKIGSSWYKSDGLGGWTPVAAPTNTACLQSTSFNLVAFTVTVGTTGGGTVSPIGVYPIATMGQAMYGSAYSSLVGGTAPYDCPGV